MMRAGPPCRYCGPVDAERLWCPDCQLTSPGEHPAGLRRLPGPGLAVLRDRSFLVEYAYVANPSTGARHRRAVARGGGGGLRHGQVLPAARESARPGIQLSWRAAAR